MTIPELNSKSLLSKCLVVCVLLLSFFTFSGIAVQSQLKSNLSYTEAAYIAKKQAVKSITWQRALKRGHSIQNTLPIFAGSAIDLAYFDNLRAKTFYINNSAISILKLQNSARYQHKTTPHNKSDEPVSLLV